MKVRFGYTVGPELAPAEMGPVVDDLERLGFDSIWVPESLLQGTIDPLIALAFAAARTERLKLGTHLILPGRHPVLLARQLAHLDQVSGGRLLLLAVLGLVEEAEAGAQGIDRRGRGRALEEILPVMRRLWAGESVTQEAREFSLHDITLEPGPVQQPLEVWLGGRAQSALERCGRLGDGWMPGLVLPHEAAALRRVIESAAADAGRSMDPEHFGANLFYARDRIPDPVLERLRARRRDDDVEALVPVGFEALVERAHEWLDAGFSKFLLRPVVPSPDSTAELEALADAVLPLTT